jgi:Trypsin
VFGGIQIRKTSPLYRLLQTLSSSFCLRRLQSKEDTTASNVMNLLLICYFLVSIGIGASSALETTDEALAPRIVGGTPVAAGAYPWFARSSQRFLDDGVFFGTSSCGASLIHPRVAISAMHCLGLTLTPTFYTAEITLYFGGTMYDGSDALAVRTVKRYEYLPNYKFPNNDIVLYTWDNPVTNIVPITFNRNKDRPIIGSLAKTIGFGLTTDGGSESNVLLQVDMNVVAASVCDPDLSESELVCVQSPGVGTCQGDSGGPLFGSLDGKLTLFGCTSFGDVVCGTFSGFAAPSHFQTFIDKVRCHRPHFFDSLSPCVHADLFTDIISSWYNSSSARPTVEKTATVVSWGFFGTCSLSYSSAFNPPTLFQLGTKDDKVLREGWNIRSCWPSRTSHNIRRTSLTILLSPASIVLLFTRANLWGVMIGVFQHRTSWGLK